MKTGADVSRSHQGGPRPAGPAKQLQINPIECSGHGACAELLPEMISLDEWGYPLLDPRPVPPALERQARRAVNGCPVLALRLARLPS
ncbi:MAG TPA: ferredoxin [Streptosporangiaceae bacterium]